jgi:hypothetical protein
LPIVVLTLLEWRYGNPYGLTGSITAFENETKDLFNNWYWQRSHPRDLHDWAKAFLQTLSATDQAIVSRRLGGTVRLYLKASGAGFPINRISCQSRRRK